MANIIKKARRLAPRTDIVPWDGKPIDKPGIYSGIPINRYHSADICVGPSISSGGLRTIFGRSLAHYWATSPLNPDRADDEDEKEQFILGRAAHHLFLGEPHFKQTFAMRPVDMEDPKTGELKPWNGNRTVCREWLEARQRQRLTVLTPGQSENIVGMAKSLWAMPEVSTAGLLRGGRVELSFIWKDKETGVWLKWRPDTVPTDAWDFVDIKTTIDVRYFKLQRVIEDFGYHQQGGLGRTACREVLGIDMASFNLLFIEKTRPWATALAAVKDSELDRGERMNRHALRLFWRAWKNKEWPGPCPGVINIETSERYQQRIDEDLKQAGVK
jgi:hypothetical protein